MHGTLNCRHSYTRILALDLGKFNSVLCDFDPATGNHRFESLETTPQAIHDLLAGLAGHEPAKEVVVMETCDTSGWSTTSQRARGSVCSSPTPPTRPGAGPG